VGCTTLIDTIVTIAVLFLALPLVVLAAECWLSLLPLRRQKKRGDLSPFQLAVVIPAHDEADRVAEAVERIREQVPDGTRVIVIADNCSDSTAANARAAGAVVWQRDDPTRRGKGYALNFAWQRLAEAPPDVVVCIDADCVPAPNCIATVARLAHERRRPVQASYTMHAPPGASGLASVSALAVYVKNVVRPRGLQWLRLPCLLTGSGMAFPWEALSAVRHPDGHIVEDMRASTDFAIAGFAPMPCMEVNVSSMLPSKHSGFLSQRTRWEHGHIRTILTEVPRLVGRFLLTGSASLLAVALELAVPPLSLLVGITSLSAVALAAFALATGNWLPFICLAIAMAVATLGMILVWARNGRDILPGKMIVGQIPKYLSVKAPLYLRFLARPQTDWVRTERARPLAASPDGIPGPHAGNFAPVDTSNRSTPEQ
jgi:cellulose synthase/poly-beta-1,6-N-acetylglucosamine synthase-like glycosyltransferase